MTIKLFGFMLCFVCDGVRLVLFEGTKRFGVVMIYVADLNGVSEFVFAANENEAMDILDKLGFEGSAAVIGEASWADANAAGKQVHSWGDERVEG